MSTPPATPPPFGDPSRRTYLAAERTLLSWWRTGFASLGVALAVGRLIPDIAHLPRVPFLALGAGWSVLAGALVLYGSYRQRIGRRAIDEGGFLHLADGVTMVFTIFAVALIAATTFLFSWPSLVS